MTQRKEGGVMTRPKILAKLAACRDALADEGRRFSNLAADLDIGPEWKAAADHSLAMWDTWESVDEAVRRLRDALEPTP